MTKMFLVATMTSRDREDVLVMAAMTTAMDLRDGNMAVLVTAMMMRKMMVVMIMRIKIDCRLYPEWSSALLTDQCNFSRPSLVLFHWLMEDYYVHNIHEIQLCSAVMME